VSQVGHVAEQLLYLVLLFSQGIVSYADAVDQGAIGPEYFEFLRLANQVVVESKFFQHSEFREIVDRLDLVERQVQKTQFGIHVFHLGNVVERQAQFVQVYQQHQTLRNAFQG